MATFLIFFISCATLQRGSVWRCPKKELLATIRRAPQGSTVGVYVYSLDERKEVFSYNAEKLLLPASNLKLVTLYAALSLLGPAMRFETDFLMDAEGNLYFVGGGDPSLSYQDLCIEAERLHAKGIKKIMDIIVCDTLFDTTGWGPGWMWDEGPFPYAAKVSALSLNRNAVEVWLRPCNDSICVYSIPRTDFVDFTIERLDSIKTIKITRTFDGKNHIHITLPPNFELAEPLVYYVSVEKPDLFAGYALKSALEKAKISVLGTVRRGAPDSTATCVLRHLSPPLYQILCDMGKFSLNLYSEVLLKYLGAAFEGPPGTWEKGIKVVKKFLAQHDLDTLYNRIVDGSGLSRYNLVSPKFLVQLLIKIYDDFSIMPEFLSALPVAGRDGTLAFRLVHSPLSNKVRAKTGTMTGVSALSGYLQTASGELLAFSVIVNNYLCESKNVKEFEDRFLETLSRIK